MKKHYFSPGVCTVMLMQLLTCFHPAKGQTTSPYGKQRAASGSSTTRKRNPDIFTSYYATYGELFSHNAPVNLTLNFPYFSSAQGNTMTNFSARKENIIPRNFLLFDVLHLSFGNRKIFADMAVGGFTKKGSVNPDFNGSLMLNYGIGTTIPFDLTYGVPQEKKRFFLKPSLNFSYNSFYVSVGSINNRNTTISVLGLTAASTFSYTSGSKNNKQTQTTGASDLKVDLFENYTAVCPKLCITNNPYTHKIYWGIDISYYLPIKHNEYLSFYQTGTSGGSHNLGKVDLDNNAVTMFNNANRVSSLPFNLKNFYIGFGLGINTSAFGKNKTQPKQKNNK